MASMISTPTLGYFSVKRSSSRSNNSVGVSSSCGVKAMRVEKPLEELYNVRVERKVSPERLTQLGVSRWSMWKTGKCKLPWDWQVDRSTTFWRVFGKIPRRWNQGKRDAGEARTNLEAVGRRCCIYCCKQWGCNGFKIRLFHCHNLQHKSKGNSRQLSDRMKAICM